MASSQHYDAIVIGSGQAGTPLCQALAQAGLRTALVEREHVGGTCINEGCTPTKTMVASGRVAYLARRGADYGVRTGTIRDRHGAHKKAQARHRQQFRERQPEADQENQESRSDFREAAFTGPKSVDVRLENGECRR